jgi:acyl carrier protein phosphodiesterase
VNFLAHLYLAPPTPDAWLGSLLGDFVKGPMVASGYTGEVQAAIRLHRAIDTFTDAHPAVRAAKALLTPARRRYAGILVDIYFDHFLAANWQAWHDDSLRTFADRVYASLAHPSAPVPERFGRLVPHLVAQDWLAGYATEAGIAITLERMSHRTPHAAVLAGGHEELARRHDDFAAAFAQFFPALRAHADAHGAIGSRAA